MNGSEFRVRARIQKGFTYLTLLVVVAFLGGGLAAFGEFYSHAAQRDKEAELLFVGGEFRRAIGQYYDSSPAGHLRYPARLDDLLQDKRFAFNRRYLRKLYADPLTGKPEWGLVESPEGGIMGVYSLSKEEPVKTGNFDQEDSAFSKAKNYRDWRFEHQPPPSPSGPTAAR
jgi:type II secretory pathway pseudopilin PulG